MLEADAAGLTEALSSLLPEVDKKAINEDSELGQYTVDMFRSALRLSADGWVDDTLASIAPWGFDFSEIKVPVLIYQGTEDKMVPFAHGVWLANTLPQGLVRKHLLQGEGHLSLFSGQKDTMVDQLVEIMKSQN